MNELIEKLERRFGLPCAYYPPMDTAAQIVSDYWQARKRGQTEGFWPMLLSEEYAQGLAEAPVPKEIPSVGSGKEFFRQRLEETKACLEEYEPGCWPELLGEMANGDKIDRFLSLWDYRGKKTIPVVLVRVPVKDPWEVFAWLPFGGWNECPSDEEHMAVAKYWFEEYGAFPALMTRDVLEFSLPSPYPVAKERAIDLALEQYSYCSDIVTQGVETIGRLADTLAQSYHWYFWWD